MLDYIPESGYFDLKEQLFGPLYQAGAHRALGDPGILPHHHQRGHYFSANLEVLQGQVPLPAKAKDNPGVPDISPTARVFTPAVVGGGAQVGEEVLILGPAAIVARCRVESGAVIDECVILDNACINAGAYLHRCVIGDGAQIGSLANLHEMAVMQTLAALPEQAAVSLREAVKLHPALLAGPRAWQMRAQPVYQKVKRGLDVLLAGLGLLLTAPLLALIALLIKLDSPVPVIFRQERCGLGGRNFTMYKFRSMVADSEDRKRELQDLNEVDGPMFKIVRNPRITRLGQFLRATNLDELPQLVNVLKGEMSLVGPRPLSLAEMRYNLRWRDARLSVRPGMTGCGRWRPIPR